jgi:hypothetical protein
MTIYRPLVDLCFQIASVAVNTRSRSDLDKQLWRLSRWRRQGKLARARGEKLANPPPETLKVPRSKVAARSTLAESILSRVVLHEMGHAASGHLALGKGRRRSLSQSLAMEREADLFAITLGLKGASRVPGAMPLFSYYNFIRKPTFEARGKHIVADWRSHPLDAERYNTQHKKLAAANKAKGLPLPLDPGRLVLPNGKYATPSKRADVARSRPQQPSPRQPSTDPMPNAAALLR